MVHDGSKFIEEYGHFHCNLKFYANFDVNADVNHANYDVEVNEAKAGANGVNNSNFEIHGIISIFLP